jgi:hypothetical protein
MAKKKYLLIAGIVIFLIAASTPALYFFNQYQKAKKQLASQQNIAQDERKEILGKLAKIMALPEGEEPNIGTVVDTEKLKDHPFFAKAKVGDKIIYYPQAQKAILYDPVAQKIIDFTNISVNSSATPTSTPSASLAPKTSPTSVAVLIKIALYNGTKINGLTRKAEQFLTGKIPGFEVANRDNAHGDYSKNLVVDLSGNNLSLVNQISDLIKGEIQSLPEEETEPEADILIILGEDNFE